MSSYRFIHTFSTTIVLPLLSHYVPYTANCACPDGNSMCIMAAIISFNPPDRWSQCSRNELQLGFTGPRNLDRCLFNEPTSVIGDPSCGNGIMEEGEACDCGSQEVYIYIHVRGSTAPVYHCVPLNLHVHACRMYMFMYT